MFICYGIIHFINLKGGISALDFYEVEQVTENFGLVLGIIAFSYS